MLEQYEAAETVGREADALLSEAVSRFEGAWRCGPPPPAIDDYLTATTPNRRSVLVELVHTDLEYRLKAGLPCRVEDYRLRYPELTADRDVDLGLIDAEYALRRRFGAGVEREEYRLRSPEYCDELPDRLDRGVAAAGLPRIAGYTVLGVIGRGGMGVVYKARDEELRRLVALKMVVAGRNAAPEGVARFRAEAEAVARLQHPNIVQVFEVGEADGPPGSSCPYIALEYADGGSLDRLLAGKPRPPRQGAALVETLAHAVQAAHDRGIIHRDLKPANVLWVGAGEPGTSGADTLDGPGRPKIADFGLAKLLDDESATTYVGQVLGTPSYMAPEQAEGRNDAIGPAADVYALGAMLYELLTGRPPFLGSTALETLEQVKSLEPLPPSRLQPKTPHDLETICLKCLHKFPTSRYARALDLANDLRRFLEGKPILARPPSRFDQLSKFARRNKTLVGGVTAVVVTSILWAVVANSQRVRADQKSAGLIIALADAETANRLAQERLAAKQRQQGDWKEVLVTLDATQKAGHPSPARLQLGKIEALFALNQSQEALREMESLRRREDIGGLGAEILLLEGDLLLGVDNERARQHLKQGVDKGLSRKADQEYALGLLAETSEQAVTHFRAALVVEPYHLRANQMMGVMLFFLGRKAEAGRHLAVAQAFFPEDANLRLLDALLHAADGDRQGVEVCLQQIRRQFGDDAVSEVRPILEILAELQNIEDYVSGDGSLDVRLLAKLGKLISSGLSLSGGRALSDSGLGLVLPPFLAKSYEKLAKNLVLYTFFRNDQRLCQELAEATRIHPEGTLHLVHGLALVGAGRPAEAEVAFLKAAEGPAIASVGRLALFLAIVAEWQLADVHGKAPNHEIRERAIRNLHRLVTRGGPPPKFAPLAANIAWQAGEFDLARLFVQGQRISNML